MRSLNPIDHLICHIDTAVRTLIIPRQRVSSRPIPGALLPEASLSEKERLHVAGLMRINHSGEVCAQGLYQGQSLTARLDKVRCQMQQAALEEVDHLAWCETRLRELDSRPSYLNPFWYLGSLCIGAMAGFAGDQYSLGFVAETEKQVTAHLADHLMRLPAQDLKSQAILDSMQEDERHHADIAIEAGAVELAKPIQLLMRLVSKVMTKISYYF